MAFIRKVKTASGATAVQIAHKEHGRIIRIEHIGSAHNETDLESLVALAKHRLVGSQQSLFATVDKKPTSPLKLELRSSVSSLLSRVLTEQYNRLGFGQLADEIFEYLCVARIVEPTSKLDSLRVLSEMGVSGISKDRVYRCLGQVVANKYRDTIAKKCFERASAQGLALVLYDVTTLYFEIQKEDEDGGGNLGYRKPGMSKERRLEPQIIVGLLVDQHGFPLELHSFEGNKAETTTILPVVDAFRKRHKLKGITVVADAGMLSAKNLQALDDAGYTYIVGARMNKIPYDIAEYQKTDKLTDGQIVTAKTAIEGQRIIYQYSEKRAALDLRNIEKQIVRAEKIVSGKTIAKKAKFLAVTTKEKKLNQALIDKAKALVGIKGYVTNSGVSDKQVIAFYHQLYNVEASFRMSKSDLRARPIFHHKRDSIEAHLTVVFASLAMSRLIEHDTGLSIKRFVKTLKPIRSGVVAINGVEYVAEAGISPTITDVLHRLKD